MASRVSFVLVAVILFMDCCLTASLPRSFDQRGEEAARDDRDGVMRKKRPFCNAFTGCGRKRSLGLNAQDLRQRQLIDEDGLASLLDNENAVDELSRQILSEAKLWEAIQDASAEIARRKQKEYAYNQ